MKKQPINSGEGKEEAIENPSTYNRAKEIYMEDNIIDLKSRTRNKDLPDETFEYCAICWSKTETRKDTPIEFRDYYIEGVGQLCPACYHDLYG